MMTIANLKESLCIRLLLHLHQAEIALSIIPLLDIGNTKKTIAKLQSISKRSVIAWSGMLAPSSDMQQWRETVKGFT
jgi:hypothetical protein